MNKQAYDARVIAEYLLGSLADEETERLDELGFTDDEFAASLSAVENDLVDAYVQGELTGPKLEQFKATYLATTPGLQKVYFSQSLQVFAQKNSDSETASGKTTVGLPSEPGSSGWLAQLRVFDVPRLAQWGFAAAALALLLIAGWLILQNVRLRRQLSNEVAIKARHTQSQQATQAELERQRVAIASSEQELSRLRKEREQLDHTV